MIRKVLIAVLLLASLAAAQTNKTTLKSYFETGDTPTQGQYAALIDAIGSIHDQGTFVDLAAANTGITGGVGQVPTDSTYLATVDDVIYIARAGATSYSKFGSDIPANVVEKGEYATTTAANAAIGGAVPSGQTFFATVGGAIYVARETDTAYTAIAATSEQPLVDQGVFASLSAANTDLGGAVPSGKTYLATVGGNLYVARETETAYQLATEVAPVDERGTFVDIATANTDLGGAVPSGMTYFATVGDQLHIARAGDTAYTVITAEESFSDQGEFATVAAANATLGGGVPAGKTYLSTVLGVLHVARATETSYTQASTTPPVIDQGEFGDLASADATISGGVPSGQTYLATVGGKIHVARASATSFTPAGNDDEIDDKGVFASLSAANTALGGAVPIGKVYQASIAGDLYTARGGATAYSVASPARIRFVDNVAGLSVLTDLASGDLVQTKGYYTAGDGGGNLYEYKLASTDTVDGGFVMFGSGGSLSFAADGSFDGANGTGRYVAVNQDLKVNARQFGVVADGATDQHSRLQALVTQFQNASPLAFNAERYHTIYLPSGKYRLDGTVYLSSPINIVGDGPGATAVVSQLNDQFVFVVTGTAVTGIKEMSIINELGYGVAFVQAFKGLAENLWAASCKRIWLLNTGSQQTAFRNCVVTSNGDRPVSGSQFPEVGMMVSGWGVRRTVTVDEDLDGQTLTLQFNGTAQTVTVSGTTLLDVCDAINAEMQNTGIIAAAGNGTFALGTVGWLNGTGLIGGNTLTLTDGTGSWSDLGMAAGSYTDVANVAANGSTLENCHAEGCDDWGLVVDGQNVGTTYNVAIGVSGCVFQGSGGAPSTAESGNILCNSANLVSFRDCWTETGANIFDSCDFLKITSSTLYQSEFRSCSGPIIENSRALDYTLDANTNGAVWLNSVSDVLTGGDTAQARNTVHINANLNREEPSNFAPFSDIGSGRILNVNGSFDHWNAANDLPVGGWRNNAGSTITRVADTPTGSGFAASITNTLGGTRGLRWDVDVSELGSNDANHRKSLSVKFRAKRTTAETTSLSNVYVLFSGIIAIEWEAVSAAQQQVLLPQNEWREYTYAFEVPAGATDAIIIFAPDIVVNGAGTTVVLDYMHIYEGNNAAQTTSLNTSLTAKDQLLGGRWVDMGSSVPASGRYNLQGSVRYNTDGSGGWRCTAEGDPGTWDSFSWGSRKSDADDLGTGGTQTINLDASSYDNKALELDGNATLTLSGTRHGDYNIELVDDGNGPHTITWANTSGSPITATIVGTPQVQEFYYNGTTFIAK